MLKPSNIRGKTFDTVKNGYDPDAVNSFLNEIADYIGELNQFNEDNEAKLEKLVEKINEYRADEDAIKVAMITAQKESSRIISDAEAQAAQMIESAKTEQVRIAEQSADECDRIIREHKDRCAELIRENTVDTQKKIIAIRKAYEDQKDAFDKLKAEVTYFKADLTELYNKQLHLIMDIPQLSEEDIQAYEEQVQKAIDEAVEAERIEEERAAMAAQQEEAETQEITEAQERLDELLTTGTVEPVIPKNTYSDLKFGKNN
ncbi:MAG: DivIVA domain-containing protein [Ruminococcus sp.]|nr:DivIVA domain-containing protein [Ruminococcus sp.]